MCLCNLQPANCSARNPCGISWILKKTTRDKNENCHITSCILCVLCVFLERPTFVLGCCLRWLLDSLFVLPQGGKFCINSASRLRAARGKWPTCSGKLATCNLQRATRNSSHFLSTIHRYTYAKIYAAQLKPQHLNRLIRFNRCNRFNFIYFIQRALCNTSCARGQQRFPVPPEIEANVNETERFLFSVSFFFNFSDA